MHECLNKRRGKTHETSLNEQTDLPEKLQTRNTRKQEKLKNSSDERRRTPLEIFLKQDPSNKEYFCVLCDAGYKHKEHLLFKI